MHAKKPEPHLVRWLIGTALVLIAGLVSGYLFAVVLTAALLCLAWQLVNAFRLHRWLRTGAEDPPQSKGIWSEIFDRIHQLRKKSQQEQAQYQSVIGEFQSMTNAFPDAALVIDSADNITWFNDAASRLLGLQTDADTGRPVTNLLRDPDFANWIAVEEQVTSSLEMTSPLDSNVWISASAVRYGKDLKLLILRNVTGVHNLEKIRRDFVANVSHELRTPLTVLLGYLESMHSGCEEELTPAIEKMLGQARQMQALLNDLLDLSRLQATDGHAEEQNVDIPAMLMQLKEQGEDLSNGRHHFQFQIEPGLFLRGVGVDLECSFRNLIANAIHYTPEGGTIRVRWENTGKSLNLAVNDTGIGIPRRDIPRLTERFYRVGSDRSRYSGGTGLGLAIVKHVLNAHQARLNIESELGEGSTFTCVFPLDRQARERTRG